MPKKGRGTGEELDPLKLPTAAARPRSKRSTATTRRPSSSGQDAGIAVPPCFIVVCKQHVHLEAGVRLHLRLPSEERRRHHARSKWPPGAVPQFRRATAIRSPRPNTLLIDSEQLESGDALDDNFRGMAADEIDRFRREIVERTGDHAGRRRTSPIRTCCAR